MKIKNKYAKMLMFTSLFNKFNDSDELVDIDGSTYQKLTELNNEPIYIDAFQELIDKYDFDGDGIISVIDINIPGWVWMGNINSSDPKYNVSNKTYNWKSLDINNDNDIDTLDNINLTNLIKSKINKYFASTLEFSYNEQLNDIKLYYRNHNYTWPTLEQVEYFKNNGTWE